MDVFSFPPRTTDRDLLNAFDQILEAGQGIVPYEMAFALEPQSIDREKRTISGVAWAEEIGRKGWAFKAAGIEFDNFLKTNPVVLVCHTQMASATLLPGAIGLVSGMEQKGRKLLFKDMLFDDDPIAEAWWQKVGKGFVRMVSIGPLPIEWEVAEKEIGEGKEKKVVRFIEVTQSELIELSVCPVGANRPALFERVRRGRSQVLEAELLELKDCVARLIAAGSEDAEQSAGDASWPDAAFVVEQGAPKRDGRTVHRYRHLPHHRPSAKSPTENSSLDVAHLRNALARVNQVQPVKESAENYRARAKQHLLSHAKTALKSGKEQAALLQQAVDKAEPARFAPLEEAVSNLNRTLAGSKAE